MDFSKLLAQLKLDRWHMLLVYIGAIGFLGSLFLRVQAFDNKNVAVFMLGLFLIGLGEWKCYRWHSWIKPPNVYTGPAAFMQTQKRHHDTIGYIIMFFGATLLVISVLQMLNLYNFF